MGLWCASIHPEDCLLNSEENGTEEYAMWEFFLSQHGAPWNLFINPMKMNRNDWQFAAENLKGEPILYSGKGDGCWVREGGRD